MRILILLFAVSAFSPNSVWADLKGDPEAIELAKQMIESIGGAEVWSTARTLYIVEKSRHPRFGDGLIAEFWRDLQEPQETYTIQNENVKFREGLDPRGWLDHQKGRARDKIKRRSGKR